MVDGNLKLPSKKLLFKMLSGLDHSHDWALIAFGDLLERGDKIVDTKGQGNQDYYDLMVDSDAVLAGLIETRIGAVAGLDQRVDAASDEPRDLEIADFITHAFSKLGDFEEKLASVLSACRTGFSVTEIRWGEITFAGKTMLAPVELIPRRPERFRFDVNYNLRLLTKDSRMLGEEVPDGKFIVHSFKPRYNNPYGVSLCRTVWWYWWFKHHAYKWWLQAAGRGAVVTPILWYPEHANEEEIAELDKAGKTFLGNKRLTLREGSKAEFPHIRIDPNFCKNLTESCDMQMRSGVLGSNLSSGTAESGTRALGVIHDKRFQERIEADAKSLMATINQQLIPIMVLLNYPEPDKYPAWALNYEPPKDLKEMRENIKTGVEMGIPISVQWAAKSLQIEVAKEGEDLIVAPQGIGFPEMPDEPDETESEEVETDEDEIAGMLRKGAMQAVIDRGEQYRENAEQLVRGTAKKGYPVYQQWGEQVKAWLGTKSTLEEALRDSKYFRIDDKAFADFMGESYFLSVLRGFHDPFEIAEERGLWKSRRGMYQKAMAKVRGLIGADQGDPWVPVPFDEAIDHFEQKKVIPRPYFDSIEAVAKRNGLTAAGMSAETIEKRLKPILSNAIRDGHSFNWVYKHIDDVVVSKAHAENIFRTNVQTSYNAGHAEAIWSPELKEVIPAFQYDAVMDERTTDICASRHGEVYPREYLESADVVPPCHYQCRSSIIEVWADEWDGRTASPPSVPAQGDFGVWKSEFPARPSK